MADVMERPRAMSGAQIEALRSYNETESPRAAADVEAEKSMRERMFGMPSELIQAPYVVVCSVWPERLVSQQFTHGGVGVKRYIIEPGSPEKPSYLLLQNTFDLIQQQDGLTGITYAPAPVMAWQIAKDIIDFWTGDHPGNRRGKKGVGVIKGQPSKDRPMIEATPAEIAQLAKMQHDFLAFLVERADEYHDHGKREKITNEHRKALTMLGLDVAQHPWFRSKVQIYNMCPRCAERILVEANFCKHCRTDIVAYFTERNIVPDGEQWPSVVKEMERATSTAKGGKHA